MQFRIKMARHPGEEKKVENKTKRTNVQRISSQDVEEQALWNKGKGGQLKRVKLKGLGKREGNPRIGESKKTKMV